MDCPRIINRALLDHVVAEANVSPRRRKNFNFHGSESDASHRLLNAMELDSYIQPHCHMSADKDESIIVLAGCIGLVFFDEAGNVTEAAELSPNSEAVGVNIAHGVFHSVVALAPGSVFFEAKAGPYLPLKPEEKGAWAPAEGDAGAAAYLAELKRLFA